MSESKNPKTALIHSLGRGLFTVLLIAFVTMKLTGVVDWSWLWVLSPIWIPGAIAAIFLIGMLTFFSIFNNKEEQNR